jgi:hypothetical protein
MDEFPVGKMPLRVDILLVRRATGQLSDTAPRDLSVLLPLLNRFTLMEFKGPTDQLQAGDLAQLLGCSFLWHSQIQRFRGQGKEFAMQHAHADHLWELEEELKATFLDQLSPEERLRGLSRQELKRLRGLLDR